MSTCESTPTIACALKSYDEQIALISASTDTFYYLFAGTMVFFMQSGFAMLCAGSVRSKNVKNIMLKNLLDACGAGLGYYTFGWGVAYGGAKGEHTFMGTEEFGCTGDCENNHNNWFFQFAFAATAATIVAGTIAERCSMPAYLLYSTFLTSFVYPIVAHTIWSGDGLLTAFSDRGDLFFDTGVVDFAGSGVVHLTGGCSALVAAIILGPRYLRFTDALGNTYPDNKPLDMPGHSTALQILGTFILWTGWYGFNPGSTLGITYEGAAPTAALCAVTTTLSAAAGAMSSMGLRFYAGTPGYREYDLTAAMNGCLGGLVAITAGCSVIQPGYAIIVGIIAGPVYLGASNLLLKLKIDDTVDAIPVHMANGIWGMIAVGLFCDPEIYNVSYGYVPGGAKGLFYGEVNLLGAQVVAVLMIIGWVCATMIPFFLALKAFGIFRVTQLEEEVGLDISKHGGAAYTTEAISNEAVLALKEARLAKANGAGVNPVKGDSNL